MTALSRGDVERIVREVDGLRPNPAPMTEADVRRIVREEIAAGTIDGRLIAEALVDLAARSRGRLTISADLHISPPALRPFDGDGGASS